MIQTFPRVPHTTAPAQLCANCPDDQPATREVNWLDLRDERDPKAGHTAICDRDACFQREEEDVSFIGMINPEEPTSPLAPAIAPSSHCVFEETCPDCGITYLFDPSRRHPCTVPGNPTRYRIGQSVQVPTADGGTVPGSIVNLAQGFGGTIRAEIHARAFGFRTTWKGSDELDRHAAA